MTNRDKINNMSNEELAYFIESSIPYDCDYCVAVKLCNDIPHYEFTECRNVIEKWLESEVVQ